MSNITNKQIKNKRKLVYWYLLVVLVFIGSIGLLVVFPTKANAGSLSLGIYPPILQIETEPPASIKTPINIENSGEDPVDLDIIFKPFKAAEGENGQVKYFPQNYKSLPIFGKMQIMDNDRVVKSIKLAPGQQKKLNFHIGLDKNEPISDYYFSIVFVSKTNSQLQENSNISFTPGGIATNVLLTVGPKGKAKGLIEEFSAPFFVDKGPLPFTVRIKNTGQHVIAPNGQIIIKNMFGQTVGKVDLLPVNILAGTIRAIPDSLQSPDATPSATLNSLASQRSGQLSTLNSVRAFWPESFLLGPYTATLTIALSNDGPLFVKSTRFIGIPVQILIGLFITVLIVIFIRNRLRAHLS